MAKRLACLIFLIFTEYYCLNQATAALKDDFSEIYKLYSGGAYSQAVESLSAIKPDSLGVTERRTIAYWKGLCLSRMQSFDRAVPFFQEAVNLGSDNKDIYYELGQALYATQSLKAALQAFEKSAAIKYKLGASLYYKGFINQILEDYSVAISTYKAILRLPDDPDKVKEGSLLQIAELELNKAMAVKDLTKRKIIISKRVIPAFQDVIDYSDSGPAADEARKSLYALGVQERDNGPKFRNGTPIPLTPWSVKATQDFKYDSNVLFQANNALIQISNTGSAVTKTDVDARYDFVVDRRFVFSPEVDINYARNWNRVTAVIANDALTTTGYLKSRLERTALGAPAAMNFDVEFNYTLRDYLSQLQLPYYSSYINFTYGNRVQFFPIGSTTLNLMSKWFFDQDATQNAFIPAAVLSQNFNLGKYALTESFTFDLNNAATTPYNRADYRITSALNITNIIWQSTLSLLFDLSFVDTRDSNSTRGLEKTISPSVTLTRDFRSGLSVNINYAYTNNISLDTVNYAYFKHVVGIGLLYRM